jgi:hypothetical protein
VEKWLVHESDTKGFAPVFVKTLSFYGESPKKDQKRESRKVFAKKKHVLIIDGE